MCCMCVLCSISLNLFAKHNLYCNRSPDSVAATKELFQSTWVAVDEPTCLKIETDLQMKLIATWNQVAASGRQFGVSLPYFQKRKDLEMRGSMLTSSTAARPRNIQYKS